MSLDIISFDRMPDSAYVRASQIVQRTEQLSPYAPLPFSASTLWRKVKEGSFPKPVKLSAKVTAWRVGEIRAWLANRTQG